MNLQTLHNCYRIALLGTTNSGKTCILAELAMNHGSNKRLTSNLVPCDLPALTDEQKERIDTDEQIRLQWNFQHGQESLDEAKKRLKAGERPNTTIRSANVRPMLMYDIEDAEGREHFHVWTEDYSGELLNTEELNGNESEAKQLRERLLNYDGLILVVDTAVTKQQETEVLKQIDNLYSFFTSLSDGVNDKAFSQLPVAIALSKWDRYATPIEFDSPQAERKKLEKYLKEHPYYDRLIKAIQSNTQNQVTIQSDDLMAGIAYGNTAVFPVSAFGKAVTDPQNGECPDKTCLQSFGIVEPFFWIVGRCDEIKITQLEKESSKIVTRLFNWIRISKEAKKQLDFFENNTSTKQRYEKILSKCNTVPYWIVGILLLCVLIVGLFRYDLHFNSMMNATANSIHYPIKAVKPDKVIQPENRDIGIASYDEALKNSSIPNCIALLKKIIESNGTANEAIQQRIQELPNKITEKIKVQSKQITTLNMIKICDDVHSDVRDFERFLCSSKINCNDLANRYTKILPEITKFRETFVDNYDKELYTKFLKNKTLETCSDYLKNMKTFGGGAMKSVIEKYQYYLNHKNDKLKNIFLDIQVKWGPQAGRYKVEGKVYLDGIRLYDNNTKMAPNYNVTLDGVERLSDLSPTLNAQFEFYFTTNGNAFPHEDGKNAGKGTKRFSLSELLTPQGGKMALDNSGGEVTIKASSPDLLQEPETPAWTKK